jgi:Sec-independent protein translocase protein TatA
MEILGIGPLEALFILLIALIAVGPRDLGKAAQSVGRFLNQLYRSETWRNLSEASRNLRTLPNRLAREAALDELDQARKDIQGEVKDFATDVEAATQLRAQNDSAEQAPRDSSEASTKGPREVTRESGDAPSEASEETRENGEGPTEASGENSRESSEASPDSEDTPRDDPE